MTPHPPPPPQDSVLPSQSLEKEKLKANSHTDKKESPSGPREGRAWGQGGLAVRGLLESGPLLVGADPLPWQPLLCRQRFCREMAGRHDGTVPTNGGRARRDVMCADPSPLLTEDQRLLPPQHREPGAGVCLGEMSEWGEGSPCAARRGASLKGAPHRRTGLPPPADGAPGTVRCVGPLCLPLVPSRWTEEVTLLALLLLSLPYFGPSTPKRVGDMFSCPLFLNHSACLGPGSRRESEGSWGWKGARRQGCPIAQK